MKKFLNMFLLVLVAVFGFGVSCASSSAGSDKVVERSKSVGSFSRIEMYTSADVKFVQGSKTSLRIVGSADLVDNLVVEQSGRCLRLKSKGSQTLTWNSRGKRQLTVYLSSPQIASVKVVGSGDFDAEGNISADNLDIQLNGSGDVKLGRVACKKLAVALHGSGDVSVRNAKCTGASMQLNGSGDIDARLDGVDRTSLQLNGSGDMDVEFVGCGVADCTLRGSGDIDLKGSLRSLSKSKKGSGDIDTGELRLKR